MIRTAAAFAARPTASCGGVTLRAGSLGMTITTITTPMAGTG